VLGRYRRQWFAKRKNVMAILKEVMTNEASALVDTDADNQAADADMALQLLGQDHVSFGYVTQTIIVSDADIAVVEERAKAIEQIVSGEGFVTIRSLAWLTSGTCLCQCPPTAHSYAEPLSHDASFSNLGWAEAK